MTTSVRNRLSVMMFLEFFIWGRLAAHDFRLPERLAFHVVGTVLDPECLYAGVVHGHVLQHPVCRPQFRRRKVLGRQPVDWRTCRSSPFSGSRDFWPFFFLMLLHSLFYVPTISITNSIAFAHLKDAQKDFGLVRLWGTIGWIAASWPFVFILTDWSTGLW